MRYLKFALMPTMLVVALVTLAGWTIAGSPFNFPSFIPFDIAKTGDVAVDKVGNVYVNITDKNGNDQIWKYSPAGEGPFLVAKLGIGMAYGLAVDAKGDLYAAVRPGLNSVVYRIDRRGNAVLLPGTDQIVWANALAFDQRGNLYVTESHSGPPPFVGQGGIWRIPRGGVAELWLRDDLLTGIGGIIAQQPVGANGIAFYQNDLYVANSDKGTIVRIQVLPDGSAGEPEVWATVQEVQDSPLAGFPIPPAPDGLALDVYGNVYVPVVTRSAIVRINAEDTSQETIAAFPLNPNSPLFAPLDLPNMLAFGTGKGMRQDLFITNVGGMAAYVPGVSWPGASLVKIDAGVPGLPLP